MSALLWLGAILCAVGLVAMVAAASRRQAVNAMYLLAEVAGIAFLGLSAYLGIAAARGERVRRLNVEAVADSTHHFLQGQLQVATRLAVQQALAQRAVATVTIRVPGDTVTQVDTVEVAPGGRMFGSLDTNGVHVGVTITPPPQMIWTWSLRQEPLAYQVTFEGCHDHAARVSVAGPRWQSVQLVDVGQSTDICNPKPGWRLFSLRPPSAVWVVVVAGATYALTH